MSAVASRRQGLWGVLGVLVLVAAVVAVVVIYVLPLGHKTYTASFENTGGAHAGDDIRISGISVGSVKSMELVGDHVEMSFEVKENVFVGDGSSLSVRLLTPVGGRYLILAPSGKEPLADSGIPVEHTRIPFSLSDTFDAVTPVLQDLDGKSLRETVEEIDKAVTLEPGALRNVTNNLTSMTAAIADRQDDLNASLDVADEYIGALTNDREILLGLLKQLGDITGKLGAERASISQSAETLFRLFNLLHRPIMALDEGLGPTIEELEGLIAALKDKIGSIDGAISASRDFTEAMSGLLDPIAGPVVDQSADVITGTRLCVPVPGKVC
ncbi:MAG: MlaD family protein [Rhodococcus sp. (in: high G+C Gram-positive bacteria)]